MSALDLTDKILTVGRSAGQTIRSPKPPVEHAMEHGAETALCGARAQRSTRLFSLAAPFACKKCSRIVSTARGVSVP